MAISQAGSTEPLCPEAVRLNASCQKPMAVQGVGAFDALPSLVQPSRLGFMLFGNERQAF